MLRGLLMIGGLVAFLEQQPTPRPTPSPAPPPGTDIHEIVFDGTLEGLKGAKPQPVAVERGYDNQPFFTPDGRHILFTANRDGKQTDIYELDRAARRSRALTSTSEGEYSASLTPDGAGFSVIRVEADGTQRLWRFDRNGANPRVILTDIKPVGYHAWIDGDRLGLFVLGQPATLQLARVSTGKAEVIAKSIGRSLHRIPGTSTISFVHRESPEQAWLKQFDPQTGVITPLVLMGTGKEDRDCAWMPDGTVLMSSGTKIQAWRKGDAAWRDVWDGGPYKLGVASRIAVAPDGKALAVVVSEPVK